MRKPDFFIAGAPKCGTTALYSYLRQHPEIFMPRVKEPTFFGTDLHHSNPLVHTVEQYLSLFAEVRDEKRVGEASIAYFYSKRAAKEMKEFNPSASIIIMLRNPIDMMYSLHNQQIYQGSEDLVNFKDALDAEEKRKTGLCLPRCVSTIEILFYREVARYTQHVQRYMNFFGPENVHVIIYDDFKHDTDEVYRKTLRFLDISPDFQPSFQVVNPRKQIRSKALHNFLYHPPNFARWLVNTVLPRRLLQRLFADIRRLNTRYEPSEPMDPELRRRLQREFLPEVERLSKLLDRDLTHWCQDKSPVRSSPECSVKVLGA